MILPRDALAAGPATTTNTTTLTPEPHNGIFLPLGLLFFSPGSPDLNDENWSSLIGIITAIVGNVLISFALNMQRYAHIRLEREWQEKERQRKRRSRSRKRYRDEEDGSGSGSNSGDERRGSGGGGKYHPPRHAEYTVEDERDGVEGRGYAVTEADPLLSRDGGRQRRKSTETGDHDDGEAYKQKSYLKSPYWWTGIIMMTTGEAGNFLAYGFAPASIVSPLGVVALISNCIIAPFMLKEPFRKRDGLGVLVAVAGAVTVVASASDNNPKLGPDEIWELIKTWEFETYFGVTVAVIAALMVASNRFGEKNILVDLGLVGLFGGYTALSTKGVASMLSYTLWRAITFPVTYLLVAILIFTAVMQIKYINRALQRFDATQVIPVQFVLFTLSVILGSAILYRDFERTSGGDAGKFVGGCVMTFLGVWLITSGRANRNTEEDDREPEPEDAINLVGERYRDEVDGEGDEGAGTGSRRSSTIRASSPPVNIAGTLSANSSQPSTRNGSTDAQATVQFTPSTPTPSTPPAALISNPWTSTPQTSSPTSLTRPAPLSVNLSTPVLPSEATIPGPPASISNPELPRTNSPNPPLPHTPIRGISDPHFTPNLTTPLTTSSTLPPRLRRLESDRLASSANNNSTNSPTTPRNSIPGPLLASPLSTSLATMVADLKRGGSLRAQAVATTEPSAARRRESVLGIGAEEIDESQIAEAPLERSRTATDDVPSQISSIGAGGNVSGGGRKRSLSGTLGDLWRGWRGEAEAARKREGGGGATAVVDVDDEERGVGGPSS